MNIVITVIVLLAAMVGVLIWLVAYMRKATVKLQTELNAAMTTLADEAVVNAREKKISLNYSPESVESVEKLLGELHDARRNGKLDDDQLDSESMQWGAYVGEVIRRRDGGDWVFEQQSGGRPNYTLRQPRGELLPVLWCEQRILEGAQESVFKKFSAVTPLSERGQ